MIWFNGQLRPDEAVHIDPADRGFLLGDGLFETLRILGGTALHGARHWRRLRSAAAMLHIALPLDDDALDAALAAVVAANGIVNGSARLTLSRGVASRGVLPSGDARPSLLITAIQAPTIASPVAVRISRMTRRNQFSPLSRVKSLNYLDSILARREAADAGCDDALLLNTAGLLAEASAANLFLAQGGVLLTPPVPDGALPGIARALILERFGAREQSIRPEDLPAADAIFLSNSLGLRAVHAVDGLRIPEQAGLLAEIAARIR